MIAYYSPARKSVKWYRKVIFECISDAVQKGFIAHISSTCSLESFVKSISISLLQVEQRTQTKNDKIHLCDKFEDVSV